MTYFKQNYDDFLPLSLHVDGHEVRRAPCQHGQHGLLKTYTRRKFIRLLFSEDGKLDELPQGQLSASASCEQLSLGLVFDGHQI